MDNISTALVEEVATTATYVEEQAAQLAQSVAVFQLSASEKRLISQDIPRCQRMRRVVAYSLMIIGYNDEANGSPFGGARYVVSSKCIYTAQAVAGPDILYLIKLTNRYRVFRQYYPRLLTFRIDMNIRWHSLGMIKGAHPQKG